MARVFFGAVVRKNLIQHHAASDIYCVARQEPVSIGRDSRRGASTTADTLEQLRFMRSRSSAEFSRGRHLLLRGGQLAKLSEETESLNPALRHFPVLPGPGLLELRQAEPHRGMAFRGPQQRHIRVLSPALRRGERLRG